MPLPPIQLPRGQAWFIRRAQQRGYPFDPKGACFGIAHMGMQAILAEEVDTFDQRLRDIYDTPLAHSSSAIQRLQQIVKKKKGRITSIEKEKQINIGAFYEGTQLYCAPWLYPYLFEEPVKRGNQDAALSSPLTLSVKLKELGGISKINHFTGIYTVDELSAYFSGFAEAITNSAVPITQPISIVLHSNNHAVTVGYHPARKEWLFIDANQLPTQYMTDNNALAKKVLHAFVYSNHQVAAISTEIYAANHPDKNQTMKCLTAWQEQKFWKKIHDASSQEKCKLGNSKNESWLHRAILQKEVDINLIKTLLKAHADPNLAFNNIAPLSIAVTRNQTQLAQVFLENNGNPNLSQKGISLLVMAVVNNNIQMVEALLAAKADPNAALSSGTTPLMIAIVKGYDNIAKKLLITKLKTYIDRVVKESDVVNRSANYHLACELQKQLSHPGIRIKEIFGDKNIDKIRNEVQMTRNMYPDELNSILKEVNDCFKNASIETFKKRGLAFKKGFDLLVENSDLTPDSKERLTIAVDHVSKSYKATLDFNEASSHDSMKETLDDYLCKLAILFSKHAKIDIKKATKQIMLAECMAAWDQGREPIRTDSREGKDAIQQEEIPRRLLTKHQKEEFLGLMQGKKPKWFAAMEDWQQRYLLQHLKKAPIATLENIDDRLLTIPSSLRFIPGLANYSEHILKVTNTETGKILHESSRMRSSVVCAIDLSDNKLTAERQRITDDNIEQVLLNAINDIKEKLPKNLNAKVKEEILQRNAILEIPITIQTLLSPSVLQSFSVLLGSGGVSDAAMVENKNIAIDKFIKLFENPKSKASEEMFKHLGLSKEGLIDVAFEGEPVKIKPIIIATNHPVNKLRTMKGPFDIEESKRNQLFSDKLLTLATKPYIAKDSGLLVAAVSNYKALLSNQKVTHAHRHLFMSSLEEIITEQCSGVAYGSCKSGKDRKGMEVLHTDAVLTYFAKYKELPSYFDGEVKRKQFIDIFVHLFNSGHQQDMASQNAPGARGIKELKNILSKDIYAAIEKSLPKDGLKEANQIASLNKPKTKLITVKALVEKNIEFLNEQGLLPPEPINKAPFFQKPPIQVASIDNYHVSYKEVSPADYDQTLKNLLETKNKTKHHDQSVSVLTKEVPLDERNPGMIAIGEMGNGAIIVERTDHNQCARSELIKMPENLTLKNIWEQACNRLITENTVGSKLTVDQFNHLFESVSHTASAFGRNISKNDMTAVLHFGGVEHSHQIANKLFKYYNDRYQEVMYKKRKMGGDTFPSDELIGIAIKQVEGRIALDPNHPIVLKGSGHSLAYVEAVMLYCRAKGYAILNQSDYSIPDKLLSSARVERFLKLIEGQPNAFGYAHRQAPHVLNPSKH